MLYLFAYTYCLFKDRDALRTERYSIQKLAIEKGFVGDSLTGTLRHETPAETVSGLLSKQIAAGEDQK